MQVTRLVVKNFRCIKEADVAFNDTTVFIGPNNVGKTAILDALRIGLTRRWGQRGTGFSQRDVHLPPGITDPKAAAPISIQIEFEERKPNDWPSDLLTALDDIVQLNPATNRNIIILDVSCPLDQTTGALEPAWQFLNIDRKALTGRGARSVNFQDFFLYVPVFYLGPLRDADDEFSARSQFWGRLIKAMQIPAALQEKLQRDLDALNKEVLQADPRLSTITDNLKRIVQILPAHTPGDLELRAMPLQPWEMMAKTEVIFKPDEDHPWLPLANHGQGIQSLAVIFLFEAFVQHLLAETHFAESAPILQLEEPETHLHPQAIRCLCATVLKLTGQKLITTHSPYFIQSVPFRDLRIVRLTDQGTTVTWLPASFSVAIPHVQGIDAIAQRHPTVIAYDATTGTLTATDKITDDIYRALLTAYAGHADKARIIAEIKTLKARAICYMSDDELAKLETWARRIRGEIFLATKWLIVEGQSDYLLLDAIAASMGFPLENDGISIIDAKNCGDPAAFAALARALRIPWFAIFDGDAAGHKFVADIERRDFDTNDIARRCINLAKTDIEQLLVEDGLEQELRAILVRLGKTDGLTMNQATVTTTLRGMKTEYSLELAKELRHDPTLNAKIPNALTQAITTLRGLTQ